VLKVRAILIAAALASALVLPATASAQGGDATAAQYEAADELAVGAAGGGGNDPDSGLDARVVSGLPFTGFDLLAMGLAAVVITGTGFALRRLSRPPQPRQ
jgi:hypothetical protein